MIRNLLERQLEHVAARDRSFRLWMSLAIVWFCATLSAVAVLYWQHVTGRALSGIAGGIAVAAIVSALIVSRRSAKSPISRAELARRIEAKFPELHSCLLAAIEQRPETPGGKLGYLQSQVVGQALDHSRRHEWGDVIPAGQLRGAVLLQCVALLGLGFVLAVLVTGVGVSPINPTQSIKPEIQLASTGNWTMTVEPGNVEVEKGTSLLVLARIQGRMPLLASLRYRTESGDEGEVPMSVSLEDPVFSGRIPVVEQPLEYYVVSEGQESPKYRATVFEFPKLERADAQLTYPDYTGLSPKFVQDVRTVTAVEGTVLTLQCKVNKPLASAQLTPAKGDAEGGEALTLVASTEDPLRYDVRIVVEKSRKLRLELQDDSGRKNVKPETFQIHATQNQPPSIKPVFPARDTEVSALEEMHIRASAADDFGLLRFGVTYALAGQEPVDVVLRENVAAKQREEAASVIALELLKAEPDQLLSYFWWAEDRDAKGEIRRVQSDMYFAEVRPFEEIYRAGQQPTRGEQQQRNQQNQQGQGQGQNAQQAQDLAKLQKDIINATWKIIRRESGSTPTSAYATDVDQIRQSQESAQEQAEGLAERLTDEKSLDHVDEVLETMKTAIGELRQAHDVGKRESLPLALAAEQKAYQALLKLRAREHEVVRQQQQQQSGQQSQQQSSARSEQQREQLQQLDLKEEENRYETQRTAQERQEESAQEREDRQVLNRLRELSRRQHDLNERLKELQSALDEAESPREEEEIRRQLQRLQDEQRQILQDTDELQSRLDQPENQERMSEQRQQLDETRDQVRRASEALEQERVTQAAAAGSRAEQQFEDLREDLRRRSSQRFQEEMREMRQTARDLEDRQRNVTEQLGETPKPANERPQLRDEETPDKTPEQLAEQRQRLRDLQDQMRDTIERAEETEPLLSERLYDSARNLRDQSLDRQLQTAERAARLGQRGDAERRSREAQEAIGELREGIEKAAEGVLGDETEALRRAREELRQLSRELNEEMRRNGAATDEPVDKTSGKTGDAKEPRQGQSGDSKPDGEAKPSDQPGENPSEKPGQRGQGGRGRPEEKPGQSPSGEKPEGKPGEGQEPGQGGESDSKPDGKPGAGKQGGGSGSASKPGEKPGEQSNERPNEKPSGKPGEKPSEKPGQGQGKDQGQGGQGEGGRGQARDRQQSDAQERPSDQPGQRARGGANERGEPRSRATLRGNDAMPQDNLDAGNAAPLTGEGFREWADRLRDVEEMVDDPELRSEAARIRERARAMRAEMKRHSADPQWDLVREQLTRPLAELEDRVAAELMRRTSKKAVVPLDRDPAPPQFSEKMRRYYQRLGSGE